MKSTSNNLKKTLKFFWEEFVHTYFHKWGNKYKGEAFRSGPYSGFHGPYTCKNCDKWHWIGYDW